MLFWTSEAGAMCTITGAQESWVYLPETMRILRTHSNIWMLQHFYVCAYVKASTSNSSLGRHLVAILHTEPKITADRVRVIYCVNYNISTCTQLWFLSLLLVIISKQKHTLTQRVFYQILLWILQCCNQSNYRKSQHDIQISPRTFTLNITLLPPFVLPADPPLFPWQHLSPVPWPVDALRQ